MIKKIYKFGGASVKDAEAVRNLKNIVAQHKDEDIFLVVSAMGKTTNMLERVLQEVRTENGERKTESSSFSVLRSPFSVLLLPPQKASIVPWCVPCYALDTLFYNRCHH